MRSITKPANDASYYIRTHVFSRLSQRSLLWCPSSLRFDAASDEDENDDKEDSILIIHNPFALGDFKVKLRV